MHYEINVSLNGQHFFATAERSIQTADKARAVAALFRLRFPAIDGYDITVTKWETVGQPVNFLDTVDPPTPPVVTYLTKITELEGRVLDILRKQADDCSGGDFGIVEQVKVPGLSRQGLGGVLTSLQAKGILTVWEPTETNGGPRNGGERITQFTFNDREPVSVSL